MIRSCSYIDLQVNRKGGWLVIEWAYERVYTVSFFHSMSSCQCVCFTQYFGCTIMALL